MGIVTAKETIKKIISCDLIDIEGSINSKGEYIHLNGSSPNDNPLYTNYNFTITIAGFSLTGSDDSIEPTLEKVLNDIYKYEISNAKNLKASSNVAMIGELLVYEVKITIDELTV